MTHQIFIAEPGLYAPGEIAAYYRDLGVPYRACSHTDLPRVWDEAADATHIVLARASLPASILRRLPNLQAVVKWGRGVERIDLPTATERGIIVAYTPFAVQGMAEAALLLMLALSKNLLRQVSAGYNGERADSLPVGSDLHGKTLGIIGFGAIGQALGRMAYGMGMKILIYTRTPDPKSAAACQGQFATLNYLLARADVVSLHAAAAPNEPPLLTASHIARMKPGGLFINTARGSLVDEAALIAALQSGRLGGAGLDVVADEPLRPDHPLLRLPNVIVTPHALGITYETRRQIKRGIHDALHMLLSGGLPAYVANPEVRQVAP